MIKTKQSKTLRSSLQIGTPNSCEFDLDEVLDNPKLQFLIGEDKSVYYEDEDRHSYKYGLITEATRKEILRDADPARKQRSKKLTTQYISVTNARGWIKFKTTSQYTKGKYYTQYIKLKEAKDMKYFKEFSKRDIIRLFLAGDLQVHCTCLVGSTKVKLLSGEVDTIENISRRFQNGETLWVYSVDSFGNFKPGKISWAGITKRVNKLIRVTLDNGEVVECTPDHRFMMRDCSYAEAQNLRIGDSLMPLYFRNNEKTNGYELVKFNKYPDGYHSVYKEVAKECFSEENWEEARNRSGESSISIHHINYNKLDNRPSNLRLMGQQEHIKFHAKFINDRKLKDADFREKSREASRRHIIELNDNPTEALVQSRKRMMKQWIEYWRTDKGRKQKSEEMKETMRRYWDNISEEQYATWLSHRFLGTPEGRKIISEKKKKFWENISLEEKQRILHIHAVAGGMGNKKRRESMSDSEILELDRKRIKSRVVKVIDDMILNNVPVTWDNYKDYKVTQTRQPSKLFNSFDEMLKYYGYEDYNHKVLSIEYFVVDNEPVYDLTINKWHNFYLDAGVIVHNCNDYKYRYKYLTYHKGFGLFKEMRYPKIRNPFLQGTVCKHLICVLTYMGMNYMRIYKDMVKSKFFKKKAQLEDEK